MSDLIRRYLELHRQYLGMVKQGFEDTDECDQFRFDINDVLKAMNADELHEVDLIQESINTTGEYPEKYKC